MDRSKQLAEIAIMEHHIALCEAYLFAAKSRLAKGLDRPTERVVLSVNTWKYYS